MQCEVYWAFMKEDGSGFNGAYELMLCSYCAGNSACQAWHRFEVGVLHQWCMLVLCGWLVSYSSIAFTTGWLTQSALH